MFFSSYPVLHSPDVVLGMERLKGMDQEHGTGAEPELQACDVVVITHMAYHTQAQGSCNMAWDSGALKFAGLRPNTSGHRL